MKYIKNGCWFPETRPTIFFLLTLVFLRSRYFFSEDSFHFTWIVSELKKIYYFLSYDLLPHILGGGNFFTICHCFSLHHINNESLPYNFELCSYIYRPYFRVICKLVWTWKGSYLFVGFNQWWCWLFICIRKQSQVVWLIFVLCYCIMSDRKIYCSYQVCLMLTVAKETKFNGNPARNLPFISKHKPTRRAVNKQRWQINLK